MVIECDVDADVDDIVLRLERHAPPRIGKKTRNEEPESMTTPECAQKHTQEEFELRAHERWRLWIKRYRSRSSFFVCEFNCRFLPLFSLSCTRLSRAPPDRPSVRR